MSNMSKQLRLSVNPAWNPGIHIPNVTVNAVRNFEVVSFTFSVIEHPECFRLECDGDGQPCWQDSCVEIFIHAPKRGGYYNFETNAAGYSLAEYGTCREGRQAFLPHEYSAVRRNVLCSPQRRPDGLIQWAIKIDISSEFLGLTQYEPVVGNLYKCASLASEPQYLSLFRVDTPSPDFHQPKFFKNLLL